MEGEACNSKRPRDESAEVAEKKRLRESDIILEILGDDGNDDDGCDPTAGDIDDVIKNLVEDISAPATEEQGLDGPRNLDLGYLLEASDDELGLPPVAESLSSTSPSTDDVVVVVVDGDVAGAGAVFDPIWGFEDGISACPYDGLGFRIESEFDYGVIFDGGLFDYCDVTYGPSETWRTESPPYM